jgi:hypothetical protein
MMNYLFGYGSLISRESRRRTGPTAGALPVRLIGMRRGWIVNARRMAMTAVGLIRDEASTCNGTLVEISPVDLPLFDKREGSEYERVAISSRQVHGFESVGASDAMIWTYAARAARLPSQEFPILQSYIDVILAGCLEFDIEFAVEFIRSTQGWDNTWRNDRARPRYARSEQKAELHAEIDKLLAQYVPAAFARRQEIDVTPNR